MSVKDFVEHFELVPTAASSSPTICPTPSPGRILKAGHSSRDQVLGISHIPSFQRHPLLTNITTPSNDTSNDIHGLLSSHSSSSSFDRDYFLNDKINDNHNDGSSSDDEISLITHLSASHTATDETLVAHSSKASHQGRRTVGPHKPVPATIIFSHNAAPLYLPKLNRYLETLPCPAFSQIKSNQMFPPMDLLEKSGETLDDLEANRKMPSWRNRNTILSSTVSIVLGITGSSAIAAYYSLQGLANTVQVFALILNTIVPLNSNDLSDKWRQLFLGTIPNVLALNFASTVVQSLVFLLAFMALASGLLFYFYRSTLHCDRYAQIEGLQSIDSKGKQWSIVVVTFLLTVVYLPLSTMAVHVLVWSDDLWIVDNPYINATTFPPPLPPLGPSSEFRDPLDFCWTTTMKRNEINWAPVIIIIAALVVIVLSVVFPIALRKVIKKSVPKIDPYTELGRVRNSIDLDYEYHRLLSRDTNPVSFLYKGYRRGWGTYQSTYLFAKLSALFIVAIIDSNNCLFRSASRTVVPIVRQSLLLATMIGFFVSQCAFAPFLDPVNNASEWTSRLNYVTTALLALLVALEVDWTDILDDYVLYIVYAVTYGLSFYFTIINFGVVHRVVKRLRRRIDFSVDIFSPRLDISSNSIHVKRRVWQESISTLFFTSKECRIPINQKIVFAQSRDSEFPPYLLNFKGSPSERHVENLKILREVGTLSYHRAVALLSGPDFEWYKYLDAKIQKHHIGPDSYWHPPGTSKGKCQNYFGNAWWVPFPPSLVMRYDTGKYVILKDVVELDAYVAQNSSDDIRKKREVRIALRALDGQTVTWPYEHIVPIGSVWSCCKHRYHATAPVQFQFCQLRVIHRGHLDWQGISFGSGFDVKLRYSKKVEIDGDVIGLKYNFDMTYPLARFFHLNRALITTRIPYIDEVLAKYRLHHLQECHQKSSTLSYRFLTYVYDRPQDYMAVVKICDQSEHDLRVRRLISRSELVFDSIYDRYCAVTTSEAATWWYIFWDDLWRRNYTTIAALELHAVDFNPHFPSSIAYTPLPRPALESFLTQRGLLSKPGKRRDFFHTGFLNKLYLRLNDAAFRHSNRAILFHIGREQSELEMGSVDGDTRFNLSSLGTGGGTDHDNSSIIARPTYRWEGLLTDPLNNDRRKTRRALTKLGVWFGLTPLWRSQIPSSGLSLDVRLEDGHYILIDNERDHT